MLQVHCEKKHTTIKTADLTYEGHGTKASDLCGVLGFVDDQGRIHLTSNFEFVEMKPKLTDFHSTAPSTNGAEETKLNVSSSRLDLCRITGSRLDLESRSG